MKKLLLSTCLVAGIATLGIAQSTPYPYQHYFALKTDATYVPLGAGATEVIFPLDGADWDDDLSEPITLPFTFKHNGQEMPHVFIESNGTLLFDIENMPNILYNVDLAAGSSGAKVYYQTIGTAPNRKFVVEYKNVSTYLNNTGNDTVNFQIVLNEGSNIIEFNSGYTNIPSEYVVQDVSDLDLDKEWVIIGVTSNEGTTISTDPASLYFHAIKKVSGTTYEDTLINMEAVDASDDNLIALMQHEFPPMGTRYRFIPTTYTSTKDLLTATEVNIYPSPASHTLHVDYKAAKDLNFKIFDMSGRLVKEGIITASNQVIAVDALGAGNYIIELYNATHNGAFKFVKQ